MAFPFLQRANLAESARQLSVTSYVPFIALENLVAGIDNLRHDVFLSQKFSEVTRLHIFRLIAKHGSVEELATEDPASSGRAGGRPNGRLQAAHPSHPPKGIEPAEFKRQLTELHVVALNRAKSENNPSLDLLFRLAVLKFQRAEMMGQFTQVLDRCRVHSRRQSCGGPRPLCPFPNQ